MRITNRRITKDDRAVLTDLFTRNDVPQVVDTFHPFPLDAQNAQRLAEDTTGDRYYLAFDGEHAVGFFMLRGWAEGYATPSFGVFVDKDHQGRGIGRQLTEAALEEARRLGCPAVRLTVYASNAPALRLYQSLGFQTTSEEAVTHHRRSDRKLVMSYSFKG